MAVQLIGKSTKTRSVSSVGSVTSNESIGNRSNCTAPPCPEKRNEPASPPPQPVGVVPIGSFEVMALAQNDPEFYALPKQTASGSLPPRMNSFKQKHGIRQAQTLTPPLPPQQQHHNPSSPPQPLPRQLFPQTPPKAPQRSFSEKVPHQRHVKNGAQTLGQHSLKNKQTVEEFRSRTASAGSAQHDLTRALNSILKQSVGAEKTTNYAKIEISAGASPTEKQNNAYSDYTTVYISDATDSKQTNKDLHVNNKNICNMNNNMIQNNSSKSPTPAIKPILTKSKSHDAPSANKVHSPTVNSEDFFGAKQNGYMVKFAHSPEQKHLIKMKNNYEDMSGHLADNDTPPQLPLKRSFTVPSNYNRSEKQQPRQVLNVNNTNNTVKKVSMKQEDRPLYENHDVRKGGLTEPVRQYSGEFRLIREQRFNKDDQEVIDWLSELKLACYFDNFKAHGFDMVSIRAVTPEDLNVMEIMKTGHRKKLLSEIAKLPPSDKLPNKKPREVGAWLGQLNLRQYEPNFIEGGFDDIDFIKDLDRNDLEMIDIKKRGHQKKLLLAVQQLNDLELAAILDKAVAESPVKRNSSLCNRNQGHQEIQEFFPPNMSIYPRDDLPPPSGQEHVDLSPRYAVLPAASKPNGHINKPAPAVIAPKPKQNIDNGPLYKPPVTAPAPKPKPKPGIKPVNNGHVSNSNINNSNGVTNNLGKVSMAPGEVQGSQEEVVLSSKSRDFFKQQEHRVSTESPPDTLHRRDSLSKQQQAPNMDSISPPGTMQRTGSTGKSPVPPPPTKPRKMSNPIKEMEAAPPVAVKKPPPPAPPKRIGSISTDVQEPAAVEIPPLNPADLVEPVSDVPVREPSPTMPRFKPPPPPIVTETPPPNFTPPPPVNPALVCEEFPATPSPVKPPSISEDFPEAPSPAKPPSISEDSSVAPPPAKAPSISEDFPVAPPPASESNTVDDGFSEADGIMADIMADIDDFSAQLDSMF